LPKMSGPSEGQIIARFKQMRGEYQAISSKMGEMELELHEHNLVIKAIEKLESNRKCYRLVGDVLVERTVGEVLPAVIKNKEGIQEIIHQMREDLTKRGEELNQYIVQHKIQVKGSGDEELKEQKQGSSGVLVH